MAINHIKDLTPDPRNARAHTPRNVGMIEAALGEVGAARSIVIDENGVVLAGNATIEAAAQAGIERVQVVDADGNTIIAVRRSGLTPEQKTRLALFDNRAAELADWDAGVLVALAEETDLSQLFRDDELAALLAQEAVDIGGAGDEFDTTPEDGPTRTQAGDLWIIGEQHRLLVGDCTDAANVERLFAGDTIDCILTDPPYSSGGWQDGLKRGSSSIGTRGGETIARDNLSSRGYIALLGRVLGLVDADVCYVFTDWRMWSWTFDTLESSGYPVRNMLVWDKEQMGMGFPWRNQHELIAFAKRTPAKMLDGKRGNVLQAQRSGNDNHPTEKPTELLCDIVMNTECETVYDPFLGSGTTLIAAHQTGRRCYGMEISPRYADVILRRAEAAGLSCVRQD